jgi:sec-independent protein translocase protein TatB
MFDIGSSELLLILVVAIVVIGPKDLPRALYKIGQVVGKAKGMARHFRTGVDAMIREAELEELQKQWAKDNERIMAETALPDFRSDLGGTMKPLADETAQAAPADQATADPLPPPEQPPAQPAAVDVPPPVHVEPVPAPRRKSTGKSRSREQSSLPLDAPQDDTPKGSSAA